MSQASEYALLRAMGKEPNPNGIKITPIQKIDDKNAWKFPDGSVMVSLGDNKYIEWEELK